MAMPGKQVACIRGPPDRLHEGALVADAIKTGGPVERLGGSANQNQVC